MRGRGCGAARRGDPEVEGRSAASRAVCGLFRGLRLACARGHLRRHDHSGRSAGAGRVAPRRHRGSRTPIRCRHDRIPHSGRVRRCHDSPRRDAASHDHGSIDDRRHDPDGTPGDTCRPIEAPPPVAPTAHPASCSATGCPAAPSGSHHQRVPRRLAGRQRRHHDPEQRQSDRRQLHRHRPLRLGVGRERPRHRDCKRNGQRDRRQPAGGAESNVISGNVGDGIQVALGADETGIYRNLIGVSSNGESALGNGGDGVYLESSTNSVANNTIAFNTGDAGVAAVDGTGNRISQNSIHDNNGLGMTRARLRVRRQRQLRRRR